MNKKGFSLVEVLVTMGIIATIGLMILGVVSNKLDSSSNVHWGINGITESRCIDGFKFLIGEGGQARQVLNEKGGGIPCP